MARTPDAGNVAHVLIASIGLVVRCARRSKAQGEVSLPQLAALTRLERGGPATSAALAKADQISPQSMGATLAALEERGFIARRADPHDGRQSVITLSAAGRRLVRTGRTHRSERMAQALADNFTPAELQHLLTAAPLLERLAQYL